MSRNKFLIENLRNMADSMKEYNGHDMASKMSHMAEMLLEVIYDNMPREERPIKVMRSDDAKCFPLLKVSKDGDVGYNLPAVFPYKEQYRDETSRIAETEALLSMNCKLGEGEQLTLHDIEVMMRETLVIEPGARALIPTGIRLEIPAGYWVLLTARSSTSKLRLLVPNGIIDQGYRGELFAQIINNGDNAHIVKHGDALVQMIKMKNFNGTVDIEEVDEISESERGADGFGSTGKYVRVVAGHDPLREIRELSYGIHKDREAMSTAELIGRYDRPDVDEDPNNVDFID